MIIYKYPILIEGRVAVTMPRGAKILTAQVQKTVGNAIIIWAEVDRDAPMEERVFAVVGTGHYVPEETKYIATVQMEPFVWHLYEYL